MGFTTDRQSHKVRMLLLQLRVNDGWMTVKDLESRVRNAAESIEEALDFDLVTVNRGVVALPDVEPPENAASLLRFSESDAESTTAEVDDVALDSNPTEEVTGQDDQSDEIDLDHEDAEPEVEELVADLDTDNSDGVFDITTVSDDEITAALEAVADSTEECLPAEDDELLDDVPDDEQDEPNQPQPVPIEEESTTQSATIVEEEEAEMPVVNAPEPGTNRYQVLSALMDGPVEDSENVKGVLARKAGNLNVASVSQMMARLEDDGLIERTFEGRKMVGIAITEFGRELMRGEPQTDDDTPTNEQSATLPSDSTDAQASTNDVVADLLAKFMPQVERLICEALAELSDELDLARLRLFDMTQERDELEVRASGLQATLAIRDAELATLRPAADFLSGVRKLLDEEDGM